MRLLSPVLALLLLSACAPIVSGDTAGKDTAAGTDSEADADTDTDTDTDTDSDSDSDTDSDTDTDADTDTSSGGPADAIAPGGLVISEIMNNPTMVDDDFGEWFEIYNPTGTAVDLEGLVVTDASASTFTVGSPLPVAAHGYVVLGRDADTAANGGVTLNYAYSEDLQLGNDGDDLTLTNAGGTIDRVLYDDGVTFPDPKGASLSLDGDASDAAQNDDGANWCDGVDAYGLGDLGSPGARNPTCEEDTGIVDTGDTGDTGTVDTGDTGAVDTGDTTSDTSTTVPADSIAAGELVITEIMINPDAVGDDAGEWFEVYNAGAHSLDLDGLTITDAGGASFVVSGTTSIAAGAYLVFGIDADTSANGGIDVDVEFVDLSLGNDDDALILSNAGGALDTVAWDNGATFPDTKGVSLSLSPDKVDVTANDDGASWCDATSSYGLGDLGTPGTANDPCTARTTTIADLAEGDLVVTEIMQNPGKVDDDKGEWLEVYNSSGAEVDLEGLVVSDTSSSQTFIIEASLVVAAGGYVVLGLNDDTSTNGGAPVDYDYPAGDFTLGNDTDSIALYADTLLIDAVEWDDGATFPDPKGASMSLSPSALDAISNNTGTTWCEATSSYGDGDLGTPGATNDGC